MAKPPPPTPKLYTDDELKKLFRGIALEIQSAHIFYKLYRDLQKRIPGYVREYNDAPAFWGLTMRALLLGAISSLCRAFDQDRWQGLNLRRLLTTLRDGPNKRQPEAGRRL